MPAGAVTYCLIGLAVAAATLPAARAEEPLHRILSAKDGASICYHRLYDTDHLRRNPRQQTTEALLSFKYDGKDGTHIERIMLTRRGRQPVLYIAGSCVWSETANVDTSGNLMIKSFGKNAGYGCIALTTPGSAEEGGVLLIDLAADGKALTLHLDSPIYAHRGSDKRGVGDYLKLGPADRVFRLTRTEAAACRALEENLPDLP